MSFYKVVRLSDPISCGDHVGTGSPNVYVNGIPMARETDVTIGHCFPSVNLIPTFSSTVFCNGHPIALVTQTRIPSHCCGDPCHDGFVSDGSPDVFAS